MCVCAFCRIESLNILLHMTEQLQAGVKSVREMMQLEDYDLTEAAAKLLVTLEQLIENLEYVKFMCHPMCLWCSLS